MSAEEWGEHGPHHRGPRLIRGQAGQAQYEHGGVDATRVRELENCVVELTN